MNENYRHKYRKYKLKYLKAKEERINKTNLVGGDDMISSRLTLADKYLRHDIHLDDPIPSSTFSVGRTTDDQEVPEEDLVDDNLIPNDPDNYLTGVD